MKWQCLSAAETACTLVISCVTTKLHRRCSCLKGPYHVARSKVCGQSWKVCLEDLCACSDKRILASSEVVSGFQTMLICEADGHVASIDNVHCSLV